MPRDKSGAGVPRASRRARASAVDVASCRLGRAPLGGGRRGGHHRGDRADHRRLAVRDLSSRRRGRGGSRRHPGRVDRPREARPRRLSGRLGGAWALLGIGGALLVFTAATAVAEWWRAEWWRVGVFLTAGVLGGAASAHRTTALLVPAVRLGGAGDIRGAAPLVPRRPGTGPRLPRMLSQPRWLRPEVRREPLPRSDRRAASGVSPGRCGTSPGVQRTTGGKSPISLRWRVASAMLTRFDPHVRGRRADRPRHEERRPWTLDPLGPPTPPRAPRPLDRRPPS